ncbi:MAG: hypothetical protein FJ271_17740 [Planctomycetes bacterium]|nr:hypothetical protein [Planctomycetota bacterium]
MHAIRRFLTGMVIGFCLLVLVHVWLLEAFVVPTGSMAPALAGHHRACVCPCCGFTARVGRHPEDCDGQSGDDAYRETACPNCGHGPLPLDQVPEAVGDHILVNKSAFLFRRPRRWEVIVFRVLGKIFVKRVAGLPGEWLEIVDGDLFADDRLVRKTLDQFKEVRILVFDNNFLPQPDGGSYRWDYAAASARADEASVEPMASDSNSREGVPGDPRVGGSLALSAQSTHQLGKSLLLDGVSFPRQSHWLSYRHFSMKSGKDEPIRDEYAYNAGWPHGEEAAHDFMLECDIQVMRGSGSVLLGISDGADVMQVDLPVGAGRIATLHRRHGSELPPRPSQAPPLTRDFVDFEARTVHHLEIALVDRRLTVHVDGQPLFSLVDLPPVRNRGVVSRPVSLGVCGATAEFRNVRLFRDVHYTQAGRNAVRGKVVRLGPDQYFVLGDNSPNSEDSRFWSDQGVLPGENILGKALAVHLPSRVISRGRSWQCQIPDWQRVRWLR